MMWGDSTLGMYVECEVFTWEVLQSVCDIRLNDVKEIYDVMMKSVQRGIRVTLLSLSHLCPFTAHASQAVHHHSRFLPWQTQLHTSIRLHNFATCYRTDTRRRGRGGEGRRRGCVCRHLCVWLIVDCCSTGWVQVGHFICQCFEQSAHVRVVRCHALQYGTV